jgi:hypothetical protein
MSEITKLLLEIRDLSRAIISPTSLDIMNRAETEEERVSAIAALALLADGIRLLREAFCSLDIPRLPFDYLPEKEDEEIATYSSFNGGVSATALRDQIGEITLEEAQSALLLAAWQRVELARAAFEACNKLVTVHEEPTAESA